MPQLLRVMVTHHPKVEPTELFIDAGSIEAIWPTNEFFDKKGDGVPNDGFGWIVTRTGKLMVTTADARKLADQFAATITNHPAD